VDPDLPSLNQKVHQLLSEVELLKARQAKTSATVSPWIPLKEAASRLHFPSADALRRRIQRGQFPPECFRVDPTSSSNARRYLIHVERYINLLCR
jgi:hypothetical protein